MSDFELEIQEIRIPEIARFFSKFDLSSFFIPPWKIFVVDIIFDQSLFYQNDSDPICKLRQVLKLRIDFAQG